MHTPQWGPIPELMHVPLKTSSPLVYRPALNPLSRTSQGLRVALTRAILAGEEKVQYVLL